MRLTTRNGQVNKTESYPINPSVESLVPIYLKQLPLVAMHRCMLCRNLGSVNIPYLKTDRVKSEKSLLAEEFSTTATEVCISLAALVCSLTWLQENPEQFAT
jgi:hypothetical protein